MIRVDPFRAALLGVVPSPADIPLGAIVGMVNVRAVISTENVQWMPDKDRFFGIDGYSATVVVGSWEKAFGDYSAGRIAIVTDTPRAFAEPIPYTGHPGMFNVPEAVYAGRLDRPPV